MNADKLEVIITPTYTGCQFMDVIESEIWVQLHTLGLKEISQSFYLLCGLLIG